MEQTVTSPGVPEKTYEIFVDGSSGTTGLSILDRLAKRPEFVLLRLPADRRRDEGLRRELLNRADAVLLCLPDDVAMQTMDLLDADNRHTVVLDTSTAHRTDPHWAYGFPEVLGAEGIRASRRISVPGCHASGFVALVAPLVKAGLVSAEAELVCHSLTGYSGGGKKMIAQYQDFLRPKAYASPRQYGISQHHKHLPEMCRFTGLVHEPVFCPVVADFYSGMSVTVPLFASQHKGTREDICAAYRAAYPGGAVRFVDDASQDGFLAANALSGSDRMEISVYGNEERLLLNARFDNLGKGSGGAAVQCLNLALGLPELRGLRLEI